MKVFGNALKVLCFISSNMFINSDLKMATGFISVARIKSCAKFSYAQQFNIFNF